MIFLILNSSFFFKQVPFLWYYLIYFSYLNHFIV